MTYTFTNRLVTLTIRTVLLMTQLSEIYEKSRVENLRGKIFLRHIFRYYDFQGVTASGFTGKIFSFSPQDLNLRRLVYFAFCVKNIFWFIVRTSSTAASLSILSLILSNCRDPEDLPALIRAISAPAGRSLPLWQFNENFCLSQS